MRTPSRTMIVLASLHCGTALADPNDLTGGVLIAHYVHEVIFTAQPPAGGWCGAYAPHAVSTQAEVVAEINTPTPLPAVWYVIAAWEFEAKRWCGTELGFGEFDPAAFTFADAGPCFPSAGLELPTAGWPGPGEGTAFVVTGEPWQGNWVPVYFFGGYANGSQTMIGIAPDPATAFVGFANCLGQSPAYAVRAGQRGGMGINQPGVVPPFPLPTLWACCIGIDCLLLTEEECYRAGGTWWEGEPCEPEDPCPDPGACCIGAICEEMLRVNCDLLGGLFMGEGTHCCPVNPCPAVCCVQNPCSPHGCEILSGHDCSALSGYWHPEWTTCDPNPCEIYTPVAQSSWGRIKTMYR